MTHRSYPAAAAVLLLTTTAAAADLIQAGDGTIRDRLCVGANCDNDEAFDFNFSGALKLKAVNTRILFDDASVDSNNNPFTDWALQANGLTGSNDNRFLLRDETAGTTPFSVMAGAPDNSLYVADNGNVGLGTSIPQVPLQVETSTTEGIRLNRSDALTLGGPGAGNIGQAWETVIFANGDFGLFDRTNGTAPFAMRPGTPNNAIFLDFDTAEINAGNRDYNFEVRWDNGTSLWADGGTGLVGIGTSSPQAPLEVSSDETFSFFRVTATGAATNQSADVVFTEGPLGTGEFRYNIVDGDGPEMRLNADGDVIVTGSLTTAGPSCAAGCDRVFDADYPLSSIEEYGAAMWQAGYLPAVGPTTPGAPMDLSEKMGNALNALEHAHIYIGQLHDRLERQEAHNAALQDHMQQQGDRLAALEAALFND